MKTFFPDHFSQVERLSVATSALVAAACLFALLTVKTEITGRNQEIIATIEMIDNVVKHKMAGSVSFFEANKGDGLISNDEIFTPEGSKAVVEFVKSKNKIVIPSSSLVRILEESNGEETVEVKEGLIEFKLVKDKTINLVSDGKKVQVFASEEDTTVKAYTQNGKLKLNTTNKAVQVKTETDEVKTIQKENVVDLVKSKNESKEGFRVVRPKAGEKINIVNGIKIELNTTSKYNVTISRNSDFSMGTDSVSFSSMQYVWDKYFEVGDYYLKIEDKDFEKVIPISIYNNLKIEGHKPSDNEVVSIIPGNALLLSWNPLPVNSYQVTIKDTQGGSTSYVTSKNEYAINDIKGPALEWQVAPEVVAGKYSQEKKFRKANLNYIGKISLINPEIKKKEFQLKEKDILFSWKGREKEKFLVKITDLDINQIVHDKIQIGPEFRFPLTKTGQFFLEIESADYPTIKKVEYAFEVIAPIAEWAQGLKNEVKSSEVNESLVYGFISNIDLKSVLELEVEHRNRLGISSVEKIAINSNARPSSQVYKMKDFGFYCLVLKSKVPIPHYTSSSPFCVRYIEVPVFEPLLKAQDAVMKYVKKDGVGAYQISTPSVPKASKYKFEIYRDLAGKFLVYSEESSLPTIYWSSNRSGVYYMRYKVFDLKGRPSEYSPMSKLAFPISPLSDW